MNDLYENYAFNIRFILYFNNKLNFVKINIKELLYIFWKNSVFILKIYKFFNIIGLFLR